MFITDIKRGIGHEVVVAVCFDYPDQNASLAWFDAKDLVI